MASNQVSLKKFGIAFANQLHAGLIGLEDIGSGANALFPFDLAIGGGINRQVIIGEAVGKVDVAGRELNNHGIGAISLDARHAGEIFLCRRFRIRPDVIVDGGHDVG